MNKLFIAFLFCSLGVFGQNKFESKAKSQSHSFTNPSGFTLIDGSKNSNNRVVAPKKPSFKLGENPLLRTVRSQDDPSFIFVEDLRPSPKSTNARISVESKAYSFLEEVKVQLAVENPTENFEISSIQKDSKGNDHIRVNQKINNIPVYGGELVLHTRQSVIKSLNGHVFQTKRKFNSNPAKGKEEAIQLALEDLEKFTMVQEMGVSGGLVKLSPNKASLILYPQDGDLRLAYELVVRPNVLERWVYFIDANSGAILEKYNHTCTLDGVFQTKAVDLNGIEKSFVITQSGSNYFLVDPSKKMFDANQSKLPNEPVGVIWTIDASNARIDDPNMKFSHVNSADGLSWNSTAVSAHTNASTCYDYYENTFNRKSLNGNGGNIISVINIADEDGKGMDNAYWNGEFMGYGNGRDGFLPLAGALDVAGHEMTHGVIENTARLEYRNQSGALNESFADIFGALIDRDDWTLGEDIVRKSAFPSGALRSLENPNQGGKNDRGYQPKNMSQYVFLRDIPSEDNGGVHVNSGIPNHAFYLFATGSAMNKDKAEQVYYHTLNNYLTRTSKFIDLRLAVIQSTIDLFGNGQEAQAARSAFDQVGIVESTSGGSGNPTPTPEQQEIPVNPGSQLMLVYEPIGQDLYVGPDGQEANFTLIASNIGTKKKPSITDDGTEAFFVGLDGNIYFKDLTVNSSQATALTDNGAWDNVAISKNGQLLAALSTEAEPFIYIFDLENNNNVKFRLFNPTYTQGVSTGEVLYADALEWDYSGENLIYDAFNRASGIFGDLEYWDVGVIRAWDFSTNNFTDGRDIQKIFTDLDEGDNIGNPAISKTNPNVIAFDYLNSEEDRIFILGANLSSGDLNIILENNTIGYPDYAIDDAKLAYNTTQGNNEEVVREIALNADRISSSSTEGRRPFSSGQDKWAVYFAQGKRALPQKETQTINFPVIPDQNVNNQVSLNAAASSMLPIQYSLIAGNATITGSSLQCGPNPGKVTVEAFQLGSASFISANKQQTFCIVPSPPVIALNGNFAVAQGGSTYQWYVNGRPIGGRTVDNTFNTNQFEGVYTVKAITDDGCESNFSNQIVTAPTILSIENQGSVDIDIFPNPVSSVLEIELKNGHKLKSYTLWNSSGTLMQEGTTIKCDMSQMQSGVYTLKVSSTQKEFTQKVVKL